MDVPPPGSSWPPPPPQQQPAPQQQALWSAPTGAPAQSEWPAHAAPPGAVPAVDQGSWWMRALFNLCMLEIGMALCALAFGVGEPDDLDASFALWLLTNIFVLPTAVLYAGMVEGIGRVIPRAGWRRALAVGLAPIGGAMGMIFGLDALFGDSDQLLGLVFVLPVFIVGALWRVPTQHVRPVRLYAIAGGVVLSLILLGIGTALAPADDEGGFFCC